MSLNKKTFSPEKFEKLVTWMNRIEPLKLGDAVAEYISKDPKKRNPLKNYSSKDVDNLYTIMAFTKDFDDSFKGKLYTINGKKYRMKSQLIPITTYSKIPEQFILDPNFGGLDYQKASDFINSININWNKTDYDESTLRYIIYDSTVVIITPVQSIQTIAYDKLGLIPVQNFGVSQINNKYIHYKKFGLTEKEMLSHDYFIENYKPMECLASLFIDLYKKKWDQRKKKNPLTYQLIYKICNIGEDKIREGLTIFDFEPFIKELCISWVLIGRDNKPWDYYECSTKTAYRPQTLFFVISNQHIYYINDYHSIARKWKTLLNEKISNTLIVKEHKILDTIHKIGYTYNDVIKMIKIQQDPEIKKYVMIYNGNLTDLAYDFIKDGYMPQVYYRGAIQGLYININNICFIIRTVSISNTDIMEEVQHFYLFDGFMKLFRNKCMDFAYDSKYSESLLKLLDNHNRGPLKTNLLDYYKISPDIDIPNEFCGLDVNKCYTDILKNIKKIPVFLTSDHVYEYDNHPIEDYTIYHIRSNSFLDEIYCAGNHAVVFGFTLKEMMKHFNYSIICYCKPHKVMDFNIEEEIKELYSCQELPINWKKNVVNYIIGELGIKYNKEHNCLLFTDSKEPTLYLSKYGGVVHDLFTSTGDRLFIWKKIIETEFINGFRIFQLMIFDINRFNLFKRYQKIHELGGLVISVNTDCLKVQKSIANKFPLNNEIGGLKIEDLKSWNFGTQSFITFDDPIIVPKPSQLNRNIITLGKFELEEIYELLLKYKRVLIKAPGGYGKTFPFEMMEKIKGLSVLFVLPTWERIPDYDEQNITAVTCHEFFGLFIDTDRDINRRSKRKFASIADDFNVILFDEIFSYSSSILHYVNEFMKKNTDKLIYATGSPDQLATPEKLNDSINTKDYISDCVNKLFHNEIVLTIDRRRSPEDAIKFQQFLNEIKSTRDKKQFKTIISKYFKIVDLNDVQTKTNIVFTNDSLELVNSYLSSGSDFDIGKIVRCKKGFGKGKNRFRTNFKYCISDYTSDSVVLKNILNKTDYTIKAEELINFTAIFARTVHSVQGKTIREKCTIFDCNFKYVTVNWLEVAFGRCAKLDDIQVCFLDKTQKTNLKILRKIRNKINSHKIFDLKKFNQVNDLTIENVFKLISSASVCSLCNYELSDDWSLDRINNSFIHNISNLQVTHEKCNVIKGNRKFT